MRIFKQSCLLCAIIIASISVVLPAHAATQTKDGAVDVSGIVPGPPPATPPTIDVPSHNTTFTQKTIDVKGGCNAGLIVRIFRNEVFAGSALCQNTNTYALQIDLAEARNDLVARQYNLVNQSSPDSETVTVYFVPPKQQPQFPGETITTPQPSTQTPENIVPGTGTISPPGQTAQFQLIIDYDYSFRGITVNIPLHLPVHFLGGTPPYAVSIDWGDGSQSVISRENTEQFFVDHTYTKPGAYTVKMTVSDKNGNQAFLQFVLIVNGKSESGLSAFFGLPLTFKTWLHVALPSLLFGFLTGFLLSHYWKRKRDRRNTSTSRKKT